MHDNLTDIQKQFFENMDNLEIIMAQGGPMPDAYINDGDHLLDDVTRKTEHENIVAGYYRCFCHRRIIHALLGQHHSSSFV